MKRILLLASCFFTCHILSGQSTKPVNTLLWRISGNGLTKPSYLFGTMHLTDKKVFQLGDSLYKSIEQSEGFAAELDMNRIGMQMVNYLMADKEAKAATEAVRVKDAVSKEVWEKYKDQLQTKFYKAADKITVNDLEELESSLQNDVLKKGEMPTFLDAYLFGIARKQGKWMGGLEDFQDQIEHINAGDIEDKIQVALFDDKYYRSGMESLMRLYLAQKLDSIDALMYRQENGKKDFIMIKRNLKMARMMDSLSPVRSMVYAVGAAHLPGDSGVISLLQAKGYTVTPVFSSKRISADKYVAKSKEIPWVPVPVKDSIYHLEMPGFAESMEVLESMGVSMKMFFDISLMKMYMTFASELSAERRKWGADSIYRSMRSRFFKKADNAKEKVISVNGLDGKEYAGTTEDGEIKMEIFLPAMEELVLNAVFSVGKEALNDEETERFFRSFTYNGLNKVAGETEKAWVVVNNPGLLFSIEMPASPREAKDVNSQEGSIIHTYQTFDIKNNVFYGMNITSMKEGMYQGMPDTSYFISVKEMLKRGIDNSRILDSSFINFNGYKGYKMNMAGKVQGDTIEMKILSILRGNRNYYVYAVYSPGEANVAGADKYLGSFKILPLKVAGWQTRLAPDSSFSVLAPVPLKQKKTEPDDYHWGADRYMLYDSIVSSTIYIDKTIIPAWCWFSSDTAMLRMRAGRYKQTGDSIIHYVVTTTGGNTEVNFTVVSETARLIERVRLILSGNQLFELMGHFDPIDLEQHYSRVFDQFKVEKEPARIDRTISKINELAAFIRDADTEQAKQVNLWWNSLEFSPKDLPVLQRLLLHLYPDFDSNYYHGLNKYIFDKVARLDSLHTTVDYISQNYGQIGAADEYVKPFVFDYLAGIRTGASYAVLKDNLMNHSFKIDFPLYLAYKLFDSLELTATLFPAIMKYADSKSLGRRIQGLTLALLDSGLIDKKMIIDNARFFINFAKTGLDNDKASIEQYGHDFYDCIRILGIINSPQSNSLLGRFAKLENRGIRYHTLIARVTNNQAVDSRTIFTMAATDEYRHELYDDLKKLGKLKLFPVSFLSQKDLGMSKLYTSIYKDEESLPSVYYTGERVISYNGQQKKLYLYRVTIEDRSGFFLGVAGPYPLDPKNYTSSHEVTGVLWEKEYDRKQLDQLLKNNKQVAELLEQYLASLENKKNDDEDILEPPPLKD